MTSTWRFVTQATVFLTSVWLLLAPSVLSFTNNSPATWVSWLAGAVLVLSLAIAAFTRFSAWLKTIDLAVGVGLVVAPYLFIYSDQPAIMWSNIMAAVVVAVLMSLSLIYDTDYAQKPVAQRTFG